MRFPFLALTLAASLGAPLTAAAQPTLSADEVVDLQRRARAKMRGIEHELAIPLLERALQGKLSQAKRAELNADLGICHASLGDTDSARAAFDRALSANILLDLPVGTSPKIRQLFESTRTQHAAATKEPTVIVRPPEPAGFALRPVEYVFGSLLLVGVAGGIGAGVLSSNAANQATASMHDRATVDALDRSRLTWGIASVSAYGLAGLSAVIELVLLLTLDHRPEPRDTPVVGVALSSSGALATLGLRF